MGKSSAPLRSRGNRTLAVVSAIVANLVIAAAKFFGAAMSGSSAMLSEGIHSVIDTLNGTLILFGRARSKRRADAEHAFGYGKELYFWTLIVAVLVFALGGGMSIYEGLLHLRHPHPLSDPFWSYVALGVALISESCSLAIAYAQFKKERLSNDLWSAIRRSKDPALFTVLFEDSAAVAGVIVAALGVFLSHTFENPAIDAYASIAIGLVLGTTALLLARESRGLLVGEAVAPQTLGKIRQVAAGFPGVRRVADVLTMYLGAENVLVLMELEFEPNLPAGEIVDISRQIEETLIEKFDRIKRVSIELVETDREYDARPPLSGLKMGRKAPGQFPEDGDELGNRPVSDFESHVGHGTPFSP